MAEQFTTLTAITNAYEAREAVFSRDANYYAIPYRNSPYLEIYRRSAGDAFTKLSVSPYSDAGMATFRN